MNLDTNNRVLSIVHICYGAMAFAIFIFGNALLDILAPFIAEEIAKEDGENAEMVFELVATIIRFVFLFLTLIVAIPSIVGGVALLNKKKWGLVLLMISGCVAIFSVPIGTVLGGYTIWVFIENNKQKNVKSKG
ncbi:MAG: hypothetical protein KI790_17045 [Cyclobacteriaceae bacterium]|nr:hypothetical protein [Cyclobacteriaceae bacterium HetDA_MAG_MS6]